MRETYSPELVEAEVQAKWKAQDVYRASSMRLMPPAMKNRNTMFARCFPILPGSFTWATYATTP